MNILAIGAHFDDVEIGCAGALAKHRSLGDNVLIQVITHSKYNDYSGELIRTKETAYKEGLEASKVLDCKLICNHYETKQVIFNYKLIEDINRVIDENNIDMIYTHWDFDIHQDHQAIGKATMAAGRHVNKILMYQSNLYPNSIPFNSNYFVDITDYIDLKEEAIMCHRSEVDKFGPDWIPFWINEAKSNGKKVGVGFAEAFQMVKYFV